MKSSGFYITALPFQITFLTLSPHTRPIPISRLENSTHTAPSTTKHTRQALKKQINNAIAFPTSVIATACPGASYFFIEPPLAAICQAKITTKYAVQLSHHNNIVTCSSIVPFNIHILFNDIFFLSFLNICLVLLGQDFILSTNFKVIDIPFNPGTTTSEVPNY
ncbi:hypothetical protein QOT17_018788 [Balamuthia mandrillaris]